MFGKSGRIAVGVGMAAVSIGAMGQASADAGRTSPPTKAIHAIVHPYDVKLGSCNLVVPSTVRIVQYTAQIPIHLTGGCAYAQRWPNTYASWNIVSTYSPYIDDQIVIFDQSASAYWALKGDSELGKKTWVAGGSWDESDPLSYYTQNSPTTSIKVGSWAGISSSRSGTHVTITTRASRYATSMDKVISYAGATGLIQWADTGSNTWHPLKNVLNGSSGTYSFTFVASAKRQYRVVYNETTYIWGATSPVTQR